jgi:hypothetical protein
MIDVLRRLILHIGRRQPPRLGDVAGFDDDADRRAARFEAELRRRPAADLWLRQGGSEDHPFAG